MGLERWVLLAFLAALAVPVLLERLRRRRALPVEFPAIRHLLREHARFQRVLAVRRWLVLALRIAATGLLVLAFARPYLERDVRLGRGIASGTAAVLVLDTSPLATVRVENEPLLSAERSLARGFVLSRAPDALVAVTGLPPRGEDPHVVFEQDGTLLLDQLAALEVVGEPEDALRVVEAARAALAHDPRAHREVLWISARRLNVPEVRDDVPGVRVLQVHPAPDEPPRGVLLRDVTTTAGAVTSEIANLSGEPFQGTLTIQGRSQRRMHEAEVRVGAWETTRISLPIPQGETFLGSARLVPATPLVRYQARWFAAGTSAGLASRTLLVRTGLDEEPRRDPHFFLRSALRAGGDVTPRVAALDDLESDPPRSGDWIFLAAEGADLPAAAPALRGWLDAGARVVVLLQSEPPPMFDLLGLTLVGLSSGVHTGFAPGVALSPDLAACLADVTTRALVLVSDARAAGYAVLAQATDGLPLMVGRRVGGGYLAIDLAGLTPARTDLPYHACFPAWSEALMAHVTGATLAPARTIYLEGEAFEPPPELSGPTSLADPEGRSRTLDAGPVRLDLPGAYRVRLDDRGRLVTWEVAANPRIDFDRAALEWPVEPEAADERTVPRRIDLSDAALLLALAVLIPEVAVALRLRRRSRYRE